MSSLSACRSVLPAASTLLLLLAAAPVVRAQDNAPALSPELASVRAGLDKYQDPVVAVHDGYLSTLVCVEFRQPGTEAGLQYPAGGMGVHFLNMSNVGPTLDPTKPQVLIYEPRGGKLTLVAAEWFMPVQAAGDTKPMIFGKALLGPMEGHPPIMPPELHHYDLHVWLWTTNSAGVFSPTNPAVKCGGYPYSYSASAAQMVGGHGH